MNTHKLDDTLKLTSHHDGFWLWDETRGMNLAMRAETAEQAYFEAIKYYQERLLEAEAELGTLKQAVNQFVDAVRTEEDSNEGW